MHMHTMTSSRLDRLFVLLENGSSSVTRSAAAKQLGEVQRLHPHELSTLLTRTATYLRSSSWDTRLAAAEAVRCIVSNVPQWSPPPRVRLEEEDDEAEEEGSGSAGASAIASATASVSSVGRLRFEHFDISKVLTNSTHLMGSEGKEYDIEEDSSLGIDLKEKLAKQRQSLNARLGLDIAANIGVDVSGIFSNEDLMADATNDSSAATPTPTPTPAAITRTPLRDLITSDCERQGSGAGLSSREMNRARRKARQAISKQRSREPGGSSDDAAIAGNIQSDEPDSKKMRKQEQQEENNYVVLPDMEPADCGDGGAWPLEWFCDQLSQDLFSSNWEHRHGSATALREVISVHGKGAGKCIYHTRSQMYEQHQIWLEDIAIRLLCVLALDRFGDFVSDAVVAPVRETCAQTLCATLKLMNANGCRCTLDVLLKLLGPEQDEWEGRHGGLLGVKYLLAVRPDMIEVLLRAALPAIVRGLSDPADDVGAVAASALIPVAPKLLDLFPATIPEIVLKLWDLLCEQDELAGACNSFMGLLAAILSLAGVQQYLPPQPLRDVVPRLWPFLSHSASSVRKATLQTLGTLTEGNSLQWEAALLQDALRHVYQRVLVEHLSEVREVAERVWSLLLASAGLVDLLHAACPFMRVWLCLAMQPARLPFDASVLIQAKAKASRERLPLPQPQPQPQPVIVQKYYVGGAETTPLATRETNAPQVRCMAARLLGELSCSVVQPAPGVDYSQGEKPIECYVNVLLLHLNSKSALQRMLVGLVIAEWAVRDASFQACPDLLKHRLHACLNECIYFDEIAHSFTRLAQETRDFIATMKHYKVPVAHDSSVLTLDIIKRITSMETAALLAGLKLKPKVLDSLEERRKSIQSAVVQTSGEQAMLAISTLAAIAAATVCCKALPEKLTPVVKPLMESIRRESNDELQRLTATQLAKLVEQCIGRAPCPNDKIIANLCTFLKCDSEFTPVIRMTSVAEEQQQQQLQQKHSWFKPAGNYQGIVTLDNQQRHAEKAAFKRSNSSTGRGPGRPPNTDIPFEDLFRDEDDDHQANRIQRRGATYALVAITRHFGAALADKVPKLWELMVQQIEQCVALEAAHFVPQQLIGKHSEAEHLVCVLQVLEVGYPSVDASLRATVMATCLARLCTLLMHPYRAVRHMASRCLAAFARVDSVGVMEQVVERVLPLLAAADNDVHRQGAVEAIACMVDTLQFDIIPYVVLLVVPLLGRMSDPNASVRLMGTHSFATLVQLMPLDGGVPEPPHLRASALDAQRVREREFLQQLLAPSTIPDYALPPQVPIDAELRSYQQAGVNWLAFLNKYKLHGILCDDMGLGKTLQSICILAGDHHRRESSSTSTSPSPSLVVCPPTLTGHWVYEVDKFLPLKNLKPVQYHGSPQEREKIRQKFCKFNLVVASYDIVRKDLAFFASIMWNYIILDEGHVIKNGKTRTSIAVKKLSANHRLILSGTPIQNNVLEIWSLFDFLMPGFLGTEKQFTARYSKPILASRDPKCSQKEQEGGALAMEALHRQVLPFLLRRMKEDVLDDLPPKITQDYYCDLSPVQAQLYEDFSKSHAHQTLQQSLSNGATASSMQGNTHIFQALRYLQNVCNHPKLVLNAAHPQFKKITAQLEEQQSSLESIYHSAKLPALKQLLLDCGIGVTGTGTGTGTGCGNQYQSQSAAEIVINQHRALVFCQLKAMLDIIEFDLFKNIMPEVTYVRLDGSIPPGQRHSVVTRFNNDPSIDVLLLTTQVGGLGLNLTGADTVIFVEHDWNPMKDLQAMDRAHRIGQRKVVNVYRLITRGTLEEKIMGLQKFKVQTANTVISSENSRMETMGTDQLLDLFAHKPGGVAGGGGGSGGGAGASTSTFRQSASASGGVRAILEELPELWDDKQYEDEYDLTQFISKLQG